MEGGRTHFDCRHKCHSICLLGCLANPLWLLIEVEETRQLHQSVELLRAI
jgi:hypothetical protein